jgi:hypothetical protein
MRLNELVHDKASPILAELKSLQKSPLVGRLLHLLSQISESPALSPEAVKILQPFLNHDNYRVRSAAQNLVDKHQG